MSYTLGAKRLSVDEGLRCLAGGLSFHEVGPPRSRDYDDSNSVPDVVDYLSWGGELRERWLFELDPQLDERITHYYAQGTTSRVLKLFIGANESSGHHKDDWDPRYTSPSEVVECLAWLTSLDKTEAVERFQVWRDGAWPGSGYRARIERSFEALRRFYDQAAAAGEMMIFSL